MENKVVKIDMSALGKIKESAIRRFHEARGFPGMDQKEMQAVLIIGGLEDHLKSLGVEPNFTLDVKLGGK
jgi:hypothetical protein